MYSVIITGFVFHYVSVKLQCHIMWTLKQV